MSDGQALALMMMKKRAEGSLDMPVKKKKKKKEKKEPDLNLPPPSPTPPPTPPPPPNTPDGQLIVMVDDNQFFDDACKEADDKLDKQKKKVRRVNGLMARLHASVQQIKERYNDLDIAELLSKKANKDKVAQARAFVRSHAVKKKSFDKKMDDVKEKEDKRKSIKAENKVKVEEKEKEKEVVQARKEFEERKKDREKSIKEALEKEERAKLLLSKLNGDKPLYVKMELCQQKKDKRQQASNEAFLKRRSEAYKAFDFKEFDSHMKIHHEQIKDKALLNEQQQLEKHHQLMQQNLKLLEKIYRGKNYEMAQQEVQDRKVMKIKIKELRERMKKYSSYVQENFKPEVPEAEEDDKPDFRSQGNQEDDDEDENLDEDEIRKREEDRFPKYKEIKRYRFLQGKSCGEIIEKVKAPYSEKIQRRVGNSYMEQMKNLPKSRHRSKDKSVEVLTLLKPKIEMPELPRPKHFSVRVSQTPNRLEVENMMSLLKSNDTQRQMKQKYLLRLAGDSSKFEMNEAGKIHDDLIANLERKLSFLHQLE